MRAAGRFTEEQLRRLRMLLWEARGKVDSSPGGKKKDEAIGKVRLASERLRLAEASNEGLATATPAASKSVASPPVPEHVVVALSVEAVALLATIVSGSKPLRRSSALREIFAAGLVSGIENLEKVELTSRGREVGGQVGAPVPASTRPGAAVRRRKAGPLLAAVPTEGRLLEDPEPIPGLSTGIQNLEVPQDSVRS